MGETMNTREYVVVVEKGDTSWGAYVPDLPGCFAVSGTYEEAERLIREAIPFHIRGLEIDGDPVPEPSARALSVKVAA
jgi:predicted RNase H-like HicB family nuclease